MSVNIDYRTSDLNFKPQWADEFRAFGLLFRFRSPQALSFSTGLWQCDLILEGEWAAQVKRVEHYFSIEHNYALSCDDETPPLVTKVFELPHLPNK
jgi:hypothetical protein